MLSFLYVYSDHSILECYNLFSGVELSMRLFFVIYASGLFKYVMLVGSSNKLCKWIIQINYVSGLLK